ncbi:glycolipid 2-alpha-mannosyltransferase [Ramicandelaber brevisporus]|nr:glycolipid 2-alpha-mannosyltransferase [Ramicandelaber brevisporus]
MEDVKDTKNDNQSPSAHDIQHHSNASLHELNIDAYPLPLAQLPPSWELQQAPVSPNLTEQRVNAAFMVLCRNSELAKIRRTVRQLEDRFNRRYNYPYVFLNNEPFTDTFKEQISALTSGNVSFGLVPHKMWSYPPFINQKKAQRLRQEMSRKQVPYATSESYRHMCRFFSGMFYDHPLVKDLDYYWRVEPDVQFTCDINYDPFVYMQRNNLKYSFTIALTEVKGSIPTLWQTVRDFMKDYNHLIPKKNFFYWLTNDRRATSYNLCHFWSNFEIASVKWFQSDAYRTFFEYLDMAGGFFYERWGDAPVHSIAAALLLNAKEVHFFEDIGYFHDPFYNCPSMDLQRARGIKCHCDPAMSFSAKDPKCTRDFLSFQADRPKRSPWDK